MSNKKLIEIDAGNLFQNSTSKKTKTSTEIGFQFIGEKNIRLCNPDFPSMSESSGSSTILDGILKVQYHEDFKVPEYIEINGNYYKVTDLGKCFVPRTMKTIFIPASISHIEELPLEVWCTPNLSKIQVSQDNKYYDSREDCNAIIETASNTIITACNNTFIPESVKSIRAGAFCDVSLKSFFIGPNIIHIDYGFADFYGLATLKVSKTNRFYDSRENCNAIIETATNTLVKGCITTKIPQSVKRLGISSFSTIEELESFSIPDNIEYVDGYAFCNCTGLKHIEIPASIKKIDARAFSYSGLKTVTIMNKKIKIHKTAFDPMVIINGHPVSYWMRSKGNYLDLNKE